MPLKFIRLAHQAGLGVRDPRETDVAGDDVSGEDGHFMREQNTFAGRGQQLIYWRPLKPLEKSLLRTALAPWFDAASILCHDHQWYPFVGKRLVK
jgi:hypothetical protein